MKHSPLIKASLSPFGIVLSAITIAVASTTIVTTMFSAKQAAASPTHPNDIHSQVIHRAIIEQLSLIEGQGTGYKATTLQCTSSSIDNDPTYIGEITSTSNTHYDIEAELLIAGSEVIPVYIDLTLIEEEAL